MQAITSIRRRDIECTRCHQILPITEFPPEYVLRDKPRPLCRRCKKERHKALAERWEKERAVRTDRPSSKECKGCHRFKSLSAFNISLDYKDGLHSHCKSCVTKKSEELKQRWKKDRNQVALPKEKLCTRCYRVFPIAQFYSNVSTKQGVDNICKECLRKQRITYIARWTQDRKTAPPKEKKKCPGCHRVLPADQFYSHGSLKDGLNNYCITCGKRMRREYIDKWGRQRSSSPTVLRKKKCNLCHQMLPLYMFYQNQVYKDGYSGACMACEERRSQEYMEQWRSEGSSVPKEKQCQACQQILPAGRFAKNKRKKDGLDFVCKQCSKRLREQYSVRWRKEREQRTSEDFSLFPAFEKTCSICHETKPVVLFYTRKNSKDGYNASCMECNRERQKRYLERQKTRPKDVPESKRCSACKLLLPASAFNTCNQRNDGLNIYCRSCQNKKHKEFLRKASREKSRT